MFFIKSRTLPLRIILLLLFVSATTANAQERSKENTKIAGEVINPVEDQTDFRSSRNIYEDVQTNLPRFGIKVNLLYGIAALTPNLSAEAALSRQSTIELSYSNNPWKHNANLNDNKKLLHGVIRAEYRYWLCERFNGHFFGAHALYSEYNISGKNVPFLFKDDYRYKGNAYGGGITYGYNLPVGKRWNVEFTAGLGVLRMKYDRYSCLTCDTDAEPFTKTYFGPTRLGINIVFLIK